MSLTNQSKQLEAYKSELKNVISMITLKFTELLKKNKMLGVEIMFRWQSRSAKDSILNNYESRMNNNQAAQKPVVEEAVVDLNNFEHMENQIDPVEPR